MIPLDEIRRERARRSLAEFVKQAWREVLEPSTPLLWGWAMDAICDHVQALMEDWLALRGIWTGPSHRSRTVRVRRNLAVNVPPGSAKSTIVSVCAPAWMWLHCPEWRLICASGSEGVALRDSMKCRDIIESEWYAKFAPPWTMAADQNAKSLFRNTRGGFRKAMAAGARITGDRGDAIFCDDPNDAQTVRSKLERDAISEGWWFPAAQNRLADLKAGFRVIVQQRLHEEDLTGCVLSRNRKSWDALVIRQEYEAPLEKDPDYNTPTSLGWTDPRTEPGALFFPERFSREVIEQEKIDLGAVSYAGQHQQRPVPAKGALFKPDALKIIEAEPQGVRWLRGWDLAATEGDGAYTAGVRIGKTKEGRYVVAHACREQTADPRGFIMSTAQADGRGVKFSIPQDPGAAGKIQARDMTAYFAGFSVSITPETGDKATRAEPFSVQVNAGMVDLVRGEWNQAYIDELRVFPNGKYKDQVDASSRAFAELTQGGGGVLEHYRAMAGK